MKTFKSLQSTLQTHEKYQDQYQDPQQESKHILELGVLIGELHYITKEFKKLSLESLDTIILEQKIKTQLGKVIIACTQHASAQDLDITECINLALMNHVH